MSQLFDVVLFIRNDVLAKSLTANQKMLLVTLAGRIGNNQKTWISQQELAQEMNIKERHLRNTLHKLSDLNLINISTQVTSKGMRNTYELTINYTEKMVEHEDTAPQYHRHSNAAPLGGDRHYSTGGGGTTMPVPHQLSTAQHNDFYRENPPLPIAESNNKTNIKDKTKRREVQNLPDWLSPKSWEAFLQHRRSIKKPMSEHAQSLGIKSLSKLRDQGYNVDEVIDQSILCSWSGLFPVKANKQMINTPYGQIPMSTQQIKMKLAMDNIARMETEPCQTIEEMFGLPAIAGRA